MRLEAQTMASWASLFRSCGALFRKRGGSCADAALRGFRFSWRSTLPNGGAAVRIFSMLKVEHKLLVAAAMLSGTAITSGNVLALGDSDTKEPVTGILFPKELALGGKTRPPSS